MPVNFRYSATFIDSLTGGTNQWTPGSGTQGIFTQHGDTAENERVWDTDPFGNTSVVWETRPTGGNNDDGGFNTDYFSIDHTKTYRFSVWVRRTSSGLSTLDGRYYVGCMGAGAAVIDIDDNTSNTDPYWRNAYILTLTQNTWYLVVGHVLPSDYKAGVTAFPINTHGATGIYTIASGKVSSINLDFKFNSLTTSIRHRAEHSLSSNSTARLQFFDPRIELCDGNEPSINDLLNGNSTGGQTILSAESISKDGSVNLHQRVEATGGDWIEEFGQWRAHVFTGSGSFNLQSYVGSAVKVEYLMVAGGGGGGARMGGGGGGGGVLTGYTYLTGNTYSITVGAGGAGATYPAPYDGSNGGNSTFNGITAYGGGGGGGGSNTEGYSDGKDGGSGGGASGYRAGTPTGVGGSGTSGQGYDGGDQGLAYYAASGGGAGEAGSASVSGTPATGGTGTFYAILGRPHYWGGGGGPSGYSGPAGGAAKGGAGGGADATVGDFGLGGKYSILWGEDGNDGSGSAAGGGGAPWTGGGGGGGVYSTGPGGAGGSGIVILRYKYR